MNVNAVSATSFTGSSLAQIARKDLKAARKLYIEAKKSGNESEIKLAKEFLHESEGNLKAIVDNAKTVTKETAKSGKTGMIVGLSAAALAAIAGVVYYKHNKGQVQEAVK